MCRVLSAERFGLGGLTRRSRHSLLLVIQSFLVETWSNSAELADYLLVNVNITMERSTIFHGKTHYKWPFSIAMLNYQRVYKKALFFAKKLVAPQVLLVACREFSAGGGILLSAR